MSQNITAEGLQDQQIEDRHVLLKVCRGGYSLTLETVVVLWHHTVYYGGNIRP